MKYEGVMPYITANFQYRKYWDTDEDGDPSTP
jgi:hypothetical protein